MDRPTSRILPELRAEIFPTSGFVLVIADVHQAFSRVRCSSAHLKAETPLGLVPTAAIYFVCTSYTGNHVCSETLCRRADRST